MNPLDKPTSEVPVALAIIGGAGICGGDVSQRHLGNFNHVAKFSLFGIAPTPDL